MKRRRVLAVLVSWAVGAVAVPFHNAVAVAGWSCVGSAGQRAQVGLGNTASDCSEVGVELVVVTQTSSTVAPEFFVVFN